MIDINKAVDDYDGSIATLAAAIGVSTDYGVSLFSAPLIDLRKYLSPSQIELLLCETARKPRPKSTNKRKRADFAINKALPQIMRLLRNKPMSAPEIAHEINFLHRAVVSRKLEVLERDGLVERVKTNKIGLNGRPALIWKAKK